MATTSLSPPPGSALLDRSGRASADVPGHRPWWSTPATMILLATTAVFYLVGLSSSGWANAFYSAAAQAGSQSWSAWFFGASDAGGSIMVDKPPASLWVMGLSVRVFGLSSWSILVPEALMGVAAVALLSAAVRRWSGPTAGLLAGVAFAVTPVATLMFRFNNPDALLALLLVAGAYAMVRSVDSTSTRRSTAWLVLAAALVGTGFLTKSLQAFLVLPAFLGLHLAAGPGTLGRRLTALLPAGATLLVASGWWIAVVDLWPASSRPYVGGSQTNSALELVLGYNGLGRVTGSETGSLSAGGGGGGGGGGGNISTDSVTALFDGSMATQVSWLLPAALVAGVALLVLAGRSARTDRRRAAVILWGGSLLVTAAVFSLSAGIIHPYYAVALAPWIAALAAVGVLELARQRHRPGARTVLAAMVSVTAVWSWYLLRQTPEFLPWLRAAVLVVGLSAGAALLVLRAGLLRRAVLVAALVAGLTAPTAYAIDTAGTGHTEIIPTAGPSQQGAAGGGPGAGGQGGPGGGPGGAGGAPPRSAGSGVAGGGGTGGGGTGGGGTGGGGTGGGPGGGGAGGAMSLLRSSTPSAELTALLQSGAAGHTWVAATVGSLPAAGYQLASGAAVMPMGGFNGTDPSPTLARFQALVAEGRIHYFLGEGLTSVPSTGGSDAAVQITAWVSSHYRATTVGGTTVYDLTMPTS